jgi:Ca2+-binding EF-hand superfamily protein
MKRTVSGMTVAALLAGAGLANAQSTTPPTEEMPATESATPSENTRVAAADLSATMFKKLDADGDNRVSAIEAANDTNVAAGFTKADADKDGYLSKEEFKRLSSSDQSSSHSSTSESESMSTETPTTTEPSTVPPQ